MDQDEVVVYKNAKSNEANIPTYSPNKLVL